MTESVYVNRDRSRIVPGGDPDAAWKIHRSEADKLGLLKEQPKPADKSRRKPETK